MDIKLNIQLSLNELDVDQLKIGLLNTKVSSEITLTSPSCTEQGKKCHEHLVKGINMVLKQIDSGTVSLDQNQVKKRKLNEAIDANLGLILLAYAEGLGGDDE